MYDIQYPRDYFEPPEPETIGCCSECGQDIFAGEDCWEIKEANLLLCGCCIDSFKTQKYEKENEFEYAI